MMNESAIRIANALLYEGYMLYPYRPSSVKNRLRFNFGVLHPGSWCRDRAGADASLVQSEFLVESAGTAVISVTVRFLQLIDRQVCELREPRASLPPDVRTWVPVDSLDVGGRVWRSWQEAMEREVALEPCPLDGLPDGGRELSFGFAATEQVEPLRRDDGLIAGVIVRRTDRLAGSIRLSAAVAGEAVRRVTIRIENTLDDADFEQARSDILVQSMISTHAIAGVTGGSFISLLDPPAALRDVVAGCRNVGLWPVLAGPEGQRDTLLCSPIILYDHPTIAPESRNELFDGTEIDEILSLRILTLTDAEKREMAETDERSRRLLEQVESMSVDQLMELHGTMRDVRKPGEALR